MKKLFCTVVGLALGAASAQAELEGPRVDWPLPKNTNIVSATYMGGTANASLSVLNQIQANVDIENELYVLGYTRSQPVFGRTVHWQVLLPVAATSTSSSLSLPATENYADGFGDLTVGATVNLFGAPELPIREVLRYDLDWSVGLGFQVTAPTGNYESNEILNVGSNQWSGRVSLPVVKSLSDWVPGRRMTLEVKPSVRFFGENDDRFGNTVKQDPLYFVEAHLTRDMTQDAFVSLDYAWVGGGDQTMTNNASGLSAGGQSGPDAQFLGLTFGYKLNDNFSLYAGHMQTIAESENPFELQGAITKLQFVWSWHDVLQKRNDFLN